MTAIALPANWRDLDNSEKFAALRDSPNLVRGGILPNVEVDCGSRKIKDLEGRFELKYRGRGREDGSYSFVNAHDRFVTGRLDILSSNEQGFELIYVLRGGSTFQNGKSVPHVFSQDELDHLAKLFETKLHRCSAAESPNIKAYVIFAK